MVTRVVISSLLLAGVLFAQQRSRVFPIHLAVQVEDIAPTQGPISGGTIFVDGHAERLHGAPPVPLDAGRHLAGLAPTLLQQPHPRPAHAVLRGDVRGLHPGIAVEQSPSSEIHQDSVMDQLRWLNGLSRTDPNLVIVASHDDEQRMELLKTGLLGGRFD